VTVRRAKRSRPHPDVNATDRDQDAELEGFPGRPVDVGQTRLESWHVLADPDGTRVLSAQSPARSATRPDVEID
jgi:hypothetical protein